ncbi:hypothetical protein GUJ93_ZPchr0012g21405 [Zizania palustris]|uniref:Uncharacterized protein n=1 Tax=Zizania palustris TaxID=103762 RepID=A0A8J5WUZ0_ZIZPA|nr:hypothetical protein GUJ93_ZPchr0012g21405 [Zizania palustris]
MCTAGVFPVSSYGRKSAALGAVASVFCFGIAATFRNTRHRQQSTCVWDPPAGCVRVSAAERVRERTQRSILWLHVGMAHARLSRGTWGSNTE